MSCIRLPNMRKDIVTTFIHSWAQCCQRSIRFKENAVLLALIGRINKLRAWVYLTIYISSYTKNCGDNFVWRNSSTIQIFKCWAFTMFFTEIIYGLSPEKRNSIKFWRARPFGIHSGFTKGSVEYFIIYYTLTGDFKIIILRGMDTHFTHEFHKTCIRIKSRIEWIT